MWAVALVGLLVPGHLAPRSRAGQHVAPARARITRSSTLMSATTWLPDGKGREHFDGHAPAHPLAALATKGDSDVDESVFATNSRDAHTPDFYSSTSSSASWWALFREHFDKHVPALPLAAPTKSNSDVDESVFVINSRDA